MASVVHEPDVKGAVAKSVPSSASGMLSGDKQEPIKVFSEGSGFILTDSGVVRVGDVTRWGRVKALWPTCIEIDDGSVVPVVRKPVFGSSVYRFQNRPVGALKGQLEKVAKDCFVDEQSNAAVITGEPDEVKAFMEVCGQLDRAPRVLHGAVILATYTSNDDLQLALDLGTQIFGTKLGINLGQASPLDLAGGVNALLKVFNGQMAVYLQAIKTKAHGKVTNRNEVRLVEGVGYQTTVGEEVPYAGNQTIAAGVGSQSSVSFLDVSFTVKLTYVRAGEVDAIDYDISNNQLEGFQQVSQGVSAPQTSNEVAKGRVMLAPGHLAMVTSLGMSGDSKSRTGVPGLMDIPVLGELFTRTHNQLSKQHLQVIIESDEHENDGGAPASAGARR